MMQKRWIALLAIAPLLELSCTADKVAGNGSQTGNPMIAGVFYQSNGKTPAKGAIVYLRKKNTLAQVPGALAKRLADTNVTVATDNSGAFAIDSIDTGTYVIEGTDGRNNRALYDSVVVKNRDSTIELPPDTLKPSGAIKGIVRLSEGGDPRKASVLAFGLDRFAIVEADGRFKFSNIAESNYDIRIVSSIDDYGVFDTINVPVKSGDTTDIGTINLPFSGIPIPKNVLISLDTLHQLVTIRWDRPDTALAKTFNVYRRTINPDGVFSLPYNTRPIVDTFFVDSFCVQGQSYEFRVVTLDKNLTEGVKSSGVKIQIALSAAAPQNVVLAYDTLRQIVTLSWSSQDTALVTGFNVLRRNITDTNSTVIHRFFSAMDTLYQDTLVKQNQTYEYRIGSTIKNVPVDIKSAAVRVLVATRFEMEALFHAVGAGPGQFNRPWGIAVDQDGDMYILDRGNARIQVFDSTMHYKRQIVSAQMHYPVGIGIDNQKNIFVVDLDTVTSFYSILFFRPELTLLPTGMVSTDTMVAVRQMSSWVTDLAIKDSFVYVLQGLDSIVVLSSAGEAIKTVGCVGLQSVVSLAVAQSNKIFVAEGSSPAEVALVDNTGNPLSRKKIAGYPIRIAFDDTKQVLYVVTYDDNARRIMLYAIDRNNVTIASYAIAYYEEFNISGEYAIAIGLQQNGAIYLTVSASNTIYKLKPLF